jgi:hypothetical protein
MLNESLNYFVVKSLNQFGAGAPLFNKVQFYLESSPLFKSFPLIAILWFYWFREDRERAQRQRLIVCTLAACLLALLVARVINNLGPFQPRPIANSALSLARFAGLPPFQEHSGVRDRGGASRTRRPRPCGVHDAVRMLGRRVQGVQAHRRGAARC